LPCGIRHARLTRRALPPEAACWCGPPFAPLPQEEARVAEERQQQVMGALNQKHKEIARVRGYCKVRRPVLL
jgi:hypothetical protein